MKYLDTVPDVVKRALSNVTLSGKIFVADMDEVYQEMTGGLGQPPVLNAELHLMSGKKTIVENSGVYVVRCNTIPDGARNGAIPTMFLVAKECHADDGKEPEWWFRPSIVQTSRGLTCQSIPIRSKNALALLEFTPRPRQSDYPTPEAYKEVLAKWEEAINALELPSPKREDIPNSELYRVLRQNSNKNQKNGTTWFWNSVNSLSQDSNIRSILGQVLEWFKDEKVEFSGKIVSFLPEIRVAAGTTETAVPEENAMAIISQGVEVETATEVPAEALPG